MPLTEEQKTTFSKGFNSFLKRTEQSRTDIANALGITPQVTSGWSRAVSVPSYEMCQKLLSLEKPMLVSEMFGGAVYIAQSLELAGKYDDNLCGFEDIIFSKGRDLSIKDFQSGEYNYRALIQDFVETVVMVKHFPQKDKIGKIIKRLKKMPNVYEAVQSEMNLWEKEDDEES